ncbi:MAG TPA: EamA family transporter [Burkholderiaceae bacterium]|nr:EamA family transporter [Burkholderiaceae bacterium]
MSAAARRLPSWQLFLVAVAIWSTTWHAILYQLAHTTPELGVTLRFALAGALILAFAAWRGERLRCTAREHAWIALQGVFMYSLAYLAVYHAERHVSTGLVAVGYSASPLVTGIGSLLVWRTPLGARFVIGGALCIAGVALIFWPEFGRIGTSEATARGALFTVAAVLLSAVGSLASSRNAERGLPFWSALGWGMLYGAALSCAVVVASGQSFAVPMVASWWASLAYLAVAGSVIAFACYVTLQHRVGPGAASTVGVMTPVFALVISALFEGFVPVALTWIGAALAVAGNVLILRPSGFRAGASRAAG